MKGREHLWIAAALFGIALAFGLLAARMGRIAAMVPLAVALPTLLLAAAELIDARGRVNATAVRPKELPTILTAALLLFALYLFGFFAALPLYAAAQWRWTGGTWKGTLATATGVFVFLFVATYILRFELFPGVLVEGL